MFFARSSQPLDPFLNVTRGVPIQKSKCSSTHILLETSSKNVCRDQALLAHN